MYAFPCQGIDFQGSIAWWLGFKVTIGRRGTAGLVIVEVAGLLITIDGGTCTRVGWGNGGTILMSCEQTEQRAVRILETCGTD